MYPEKRIKDHINSLKRHLKGKITHNYNPLFLNDFKNNSLCATVLFTGTSEEMYLKELELRNDYKIGYNYAIGGTCNGVASQYKHGGSIDFPDYLRFLSLLDYCFENSLYIDSYFLYDNSYLYFRTLVDNQRPEKNIRFYYSLIDDTKGLVFNNIEVKYYSQPYVLYQGRLITKQEAYQYTKVSKSTIKKRLNTYGWTVEEAFGFSPPPIKGFELVVLNGIECKYDSKNSSYTKEDLIEFYNLYKTGDRSFSSYCLSKNVNPRNITRFFKRYDLASKTDRRSKEFRNNVK